VANPRIEDLGVIGISLIGIWLSVQAVMSLALYLSMLLFHEIPSLGWEELFVPTIQGLMGWLLLLRRADIAEYLFQGLEPVAVDSRPPLAESLVALLGAWFVVESAAQAAQVEMNLFHEFVLSSIPPDPATDFLSY
jgi:hypothetical protein